MNGDDVPVPVKDESPTARGTKNDVELGFGIAAFLGAAALVRTFTRKRSE